MGSNMSKEKMCTSTSSSSSYHRQNPHNKRQSCDIDTQLPVLDFTQIEQNLRDKFLVKPPSDDTWLQYIHLFSADSPFGPDCVLLVDGQKIYINKAFLSRHSEVFKAMFEKDFQEKNMEEIPIEEVEYQEFAELLIAIYKVGSIYPSKQNQAVKSSNVDSLLKLSDKFGMLELMQECVEFICGDANVAGGKKLLLVQQHMSEKLEKFISDNFSSLRKVKKLEDQPEFSQFEDKTKALLLNNLLRNTTL